MYFVSFFKISRNLINSSLSKNFSIFFYSQNKNSSNGFNKVVSSVNQLSKVKNQPNNRYAQLLDEDDEEENQSQNQQFRPRKRKGRSI